MAQVTALQVYGVSGMVRTFSAKAEADTTVVTVDWTLQPRDLTWSLEARDTAWSVQPRDLTWTVEAK